MKYVLLILMVIFVTNLDIYLYHEQIIPYRPASFLLPLFLGLTLVSFNPKAYLKIAKTHSFLFFFAFCILSALYAIQGYSSTEAVLTALTNSLLTLLLYCCSVIVFMKTELRYLRIFLLSCLILLAGSLLFDTFVGLDKLSTELRKGGFAVNPNIAASAMKFIGLCLILTYRNNKKVRLIVMMILVSAIFMTFSRSGIIGVIILATFLLINEWKLGYNLQLKSLVFTSFKGAGILFVTYILLLNLAQFVQKEIPEFSKGDAGQRIDLLLGKTKKNGGLTRDDNSQYGRKQIALRYLDHFMDHPFGSGTGYTSDKLINLKDTHNYYLKAAVEFGIIGLFILLIYIFYGFIISRKYDNFYYMVFTVMLLFECFISHGLFMEKAIIIALAFMDSTLYFNNDNMLS
nr:O-antigen ligase family protein [uncultured Psychroserpens sp.]